MIIFLIVLAALGGVKALDSAVQHKQASKARSLGLRSDSNVQIKYRADVTATTVTSDSLTTQLVVAEQQVYTPNPGANTDSTLNISYTMQHLNPTQDRVIEWPQGSKPGQMVIIINYGTATIQFNGSFVDAVNKPVPSIWFFPGNSCPFQWNGSNWKSMCSGFRTKAA